MCEALATVQNGASMSTRPSCAISHALLFVFIEAVRISILYYWIETALSEEVVILYLKKTFVTL
jgi:hypothetical protein